MISVISVLLYYIFNKANISQKCTSMYAVHTGGNSFSKVPSFRELYTDPSKYILKNTHFKTETISVFHGF